MKVLSQLDLEKFEGIVEADETYFFYSEKGSRTIKGRKPRKRGRKSKGEKKSWGINKKEQVCVLVTRDRTKATTVKTVCMGRITKPKITEVIGPKLSKNNVLVTDAWRGFMTYAKEKGYRTLPFKIWWQRTGY